MSESVRSLRDARIFNLQHDVLQQSRVFTPEFWGRDWYIILARVMMASISQWRNPPSLGLGGSFLGLCVKRGPS